MEALYSKLYEKYTKLKAEKETEIEEVIRDHEVKFMTFVAASDEMVQHLKNENDRLNDKIADLRSEAFSVRSKDELHAECQKLLMEENQKNKNLLEENVKLQKLQCKGLFCTTRKDKSETGAVKTTGSSQVVSTPDEFDEHGTRKRRRHYGTVAEDTVAPCTSEHPPIRNSENDLSVQTVSIGTGLGNDQPECCWRKIVPSGGGININGPFKCMFQDLIECLVDMKLSTVAQSDGRCTKVLHKSGYSFSLTWVDEAGEEEVWLLYRVLSLGTFERVAPEWMREEIKFRTSMCPIFFQKLSQVIKVQVH